ncbi:MAG: GtrA family protein [Pseudomonadota bacterium]
MIEALRRGVRGPVFQQLLRYGIVGVLTNVGGYAVYLLLTWVWASPKVVMTGLYVAGAVAAFFANRRFTFNNDGHIGRAGGRYLIAHVLGYLVNLCLLLVFVDSLGFPHQAVQAVAIVVVAVFLFFVSRWYVFQSTPSQSNPERR